jgi:hypothetical protein
MNDLPNRRVDREYFSFAILLMLVLLASVAGNALPGDAHRQSSQFLSQVAGGVRPSP